MSAVINNDYQTNLLFKQFTGVAATQLDQQFSNEPYRVVKNIFSRDIFIEEVPSQAPISIYDLDNSANWTDSSGATPSPSINVLSGSSFAQIYSDSHLEFYKNLELTAVPGSNSRVWYALDASGENILADTLNFKFDDINSTYLMRVKYSPAGTYINTTINSYPLYWVMDNQSGYLQLYQTTAILASAANIPTNPPKMSFFKYVGKKGLLNLDISGQQQVSDISGLDLDISNIIINIDNLNRVVLPDGLVDYNTDISGANYDLCGNEVVRNYYQYTRANTFIGYENLPIMDGSAVNHIGDPSHNNIIYELDVSGNAYISGRANLFDVSCANLDVSGNLMVEGHSQLVDVSCANLDVSGNLMVEGHSQLVDVSCVNLDVSGNLMVEGHSQLVDVSCVNLDVSGNLKVEGHSQLVDVSCANLDVSGNLKVEGHSQLVDVSCVNLDVSGNLRVEGHSQLVDVSCANLDVSGNLRVEGHSQLVDISAGILDLSGDLLMNCNRILDVSGIFFCDGTYIGEGNSFDISLNQILKIKTDISNDSMQFGDGGNETLLFGFTPGASANINTLGTRPVIVENVSMLSNQIIGLGRARMSQGSEALPSITFETDQDTGIYYATNTSSGGDGIGFTIDASRVVIIDNSGLYAFTDISMNMNQIVNIADATDSSGVPSWGQVQALVAGGGGSYWTQVGGSGALYYNSGNVGIGTSNPNAVLDVSGDANIDSNTTIAESALLSQISKDANLYVRNANLVDSLKLDFATFYTDIWLNMLNKNIGLGNLGDAGAVPTFSSALGPTIIPIAYLDINQNYTPAPPLIDRPFIANTMAYFTIKFAEPPTPSQTPPGLIHWDQAQLNPGTNKSFLGGLVEQTIHFVAGYIDNYQDINELRNPKPFIKILSTNIINQKCLTGITTNAGAPADIQTLTNNFTTYYQSSPTTPKIGGISRIIIAEGLPDAPADPTIQNKAWLCLEQTWNDEPWQGSVNRQALTDMVADHIIDVKMYNNNTGELSTTRDTSANTLNTDWQLVKKEQIITGGIYDWIKFILPMGANTNPANVFGTGPTNPASIQQYTLQVGGTPVPAPPGYPIIYPTANLWEVWLSLKDWPYAISTCEEVFENNVDICGNLVIDGSTQAQNITATDIKCNNIDVASSIDVGPSAELKIVENQIRSTNTATSWAPNPGGVGSFDPGLELEAENFYFDCTSTGPSRGLVVSLGDNTSNTFFRIVDNNNNYQTGLGLPPLFQVEGSGYTQTQTMVPWVDMCYNLGTGPGPYLRRYNNLYVGGVDTSGNIDLSGDLIVDGSMNLNGNMDISGDTNIYGNIFIDGNIDISGDIYSSNDNNIDISGNLNINGTLIVNDISTVNLRVENILSDLSLNNNNIIGVDEYSGKSIILGTPGKLEIKDANFTGSGSNDIFKVNGNSNYNKASFGGYDYTNGVGVIGNINPTERVVIDLSAGSALFANNIANSDSVITTLGGIKIQPLQSNSNGAPPNYAAPGWGASLYLGEWGWGNYPTGWGPRLSQRTNDKYRPGSGNVYCNAVRQNIIYTGLNSQGPIWNQGYQGASANSMYYNQGDIRYIIVDPKNGVSNICSVILPSIKEPMLGQAITVSRSNVPNTYIGYKTGVYVQANTPDRINCPSSIFINAGSFGGIALDPYNDMSGNSSIDFPVPYKGTDICSVTLVASQNGYYTETPTSSGAPQGGTITTQFVWQYINSGSPGI
jgi:hypothetical protein